MGDADGVTRAGFPFAVTVARLPDTLSDPRDGDGADGDIAARKKGTPQLLLKWLKKNGAVINKSVRIDHGPNGRGLFMRKPAHSSDQMCEPPPSNLRSPTKSNPAQPNSCRT